MLSRLCWVFVSCLMVIGCGDCEEHNTPQNNDTPRDMVSDTEEMSEDQTIDMDMSGDMDMMVQTCQKRSVSDGSMVTATVNGWQVEVDAQTGQWRAGQMSGPPLCVETPEGWVATVRAADGAPSKRERFGSFRFNIKNVPWLTMTGEVEVKQENGEVHIEYAVAGQANPIKLVFSPQGTDDLRIELFKGTALSISQWSTTCGADEGFFGLGSQTYGMSLRGGTYPLWTQEHGIGKPDDGGFFPINNIPEAAHAPLGIWHSSAGYTAIITHDGWSLLDLCESAPERTQLTSYKARPGVVLVKGDTVLDRMTQATSKHIGRPPQPPPWIFSPWNDAVGGPDRVKQVAKTLRDNDIPSSAIWAQDWIGGSQTANGFRLSYAWEWDPVTYPTLPEDIKQLHADGFAFLAYFNTFVPNTTRMFQEGKDDGYLIKDDKGEVYTFQDPAFRDASLVDLTNPDARTWFRDYMVRAARDLEIDGWMADFSEWLPTDSVLASGEDPWMVHNLYPVYHQQVTKEAMEQVHPAAGEAAYDWTFFARGGWASINGGTPAQAATMWGADQDTDWDYDDGYPTIVPIGANLGLSGVPFFGSDIAGYTSLQAPNTTKSLFYRWSMVGAFHPVMRTHHGSDKCGNWSFDRDMETLAHYRRYASIHTLLYPYFNQLMGEAMDKGWPIIRHPFVYSNSPLMWANRDYQYFLGEDLLVSPVLEKDSTNRTITIPGDARQWWPLFAKRPGYAQVVDVENTNITQVKVDAPITEIPVSVRPGTVLPLLSGVLDSFYGATTAGVSSLGGVLKGYRLGLYYDAQGALDEVSFGDVGAKVTISGDGWAPADALDWSKARVGNNPIRLNCGDTTAVKTCIDGQSIRFAGTTGTVTIPTLADETKVATLNIAAEQRMVLRLYVGGDVFGQWAASTTVTDLNPDIKPPCETD